MKSKQSKKSEIKIFFIISFGFIFSTGVFAQGSCASPDGSFFDPNGIYPVSYTMAQDSSWCKSIPIPSSTPTTVCYQFRYPATGNIQMSFLVSTTGCSSGDCGQNYYINQSNPSNCGSSTFCSGTAVSNFRIYNPDCSLFGTNTKIGCGMKRDSIYTLCIDVNPTGCTSINICPIINCPSANCIPDPPCNFSTNISGVDSICAGEHITLVASGLGDYSWSTGDTTSSITVTPSATSTYTVVVANGACSATATHLVVVNPLPVADFTISPSDFISPKTLLVFTNTSNNGISTFWNFGDPLSGIDNTSNVFSPQHTYSSEGDFCTTLITTGLGYCADTTEKCISVIEKYIIIPNVFTPNDDDINDWFYFENKGFKELTCSVYDRWGLKMTEWNAIDGGWDGRTTSGKIAPDGVYYYILRATAIDGEITEQQGFLQLFKNLQ